MVGLISRGYFLTSRIGLATARRLGQAGCKVIISSRRQVNVDEAVQSLTKEGIDAHGITANQRIKEDREKLLNFVSFKQCNVSVAQLDRTVV